MTPQTLNAEDAKDAEERRGNQISFIFLNFLRVESLLKPITNRSCK